MPDNVSQTIQLTKADNQVTLPEVGGFTGAIVAAAMGFAWVYSKFKRDNSENSAGTALYNNLADQLTKLTTRLEVIEKDRDEWQKRAVELEVKVKGLEKLEAENSRLITRLDAKDEQLKVKDNQIAILLDEAAAKSRQIEVLTEKVHDLELRFERRERDYCSNCEHIIKD